MTMRVRTMAAAALAAFIVCSADASVAPDPSDSTVLVANVAEGVTETYADKIASSYTKFVKTGKGTLILTAASSNSKDPPYFQGAVEVRQGILQLDNYNAIRSASYINDTTQYKVSVSSNAQIRVTFNALMGTIVNGQSRAILPVRFPLCFACQLIAAFLPVRSVFKKSQLCLPLIRNPQPSPRLHRIVRLRGCNLRDALVCTGLNALTRDGTS